MPILDLQKRARELGRIRIGQKGDRGQPQKLDRFRLTSASKPLLDKCAALYGGTVVAWTPAGGAAQWEVLTDATRIPIMVPPQPVSQWLETWSAGGCTHRCDGVINALTGEPCDPDDRAHQEARPTTRLNVVLRDVEGIGVWRLESHGWNAAVELPNAAEFLARVGEYVNGWVGLEERVSKSIDDQGKAQTRRYMVPIIEIDVTPAELMAGRGGIAPPQIEGPVVRQIEAGPRDWLAEAAAMETVEGLRALWRDANAAGAGDVVLDGIADLAAAAGKAATATDPGEDVDTLWARCVMAAGDIGWNLDTLNDHYAELHDGDMPEAATVDGLHEYLRVLRALGAKVPA